MRIMIAGEITCLLPQYELFLLHFFSFSEFVYTKETPGLLLQWLSCLLISVYIRHNHFNMCKCHLLHTYLWKSLFMYSRVHRVDWTLYAFHYVGSLCVWKQFHQSLWFYHCIIHHVVLGGFWCCMFIPDPPHLISYVSIVELSHRSLLGGNWT